MLIILQGINHFQEAILPLVIRKACCFVSILSVIAFLIFNFVNWSACTKYEFSFQGKDFIANSSMAHLFAPEDGENSISKESNNSSTTSDSIWSPKSLGLQSLDASDPRVELSQVEGAMDPYLVTTLPVQYLKVLH